jgi:hypothetical protein
MRARCGGARHGKRRHSADGAKMLRVLIVAVVAMAVFVFLRLVLLSFSSKPPRREPTVAPTIEARPKFNAAMTVRRFEFRRFDAQTGPADPENFKETMTLHAAPEGTDDIGIYSLTVATPKALAQTVAQGSEYSFQRNVLVVPRYDAALIERALHAHINEIVYLSGDNS